MPEQLAEDLTAIKEAGLHIADIIKKMKSNQQNLVEPHSEGANIFKIEDEISILSVEDEDDDFDPSEKILTDQSIDFPTGTSNSLRIFLSPFIVS